MSIDIEEHMDKAYLMALSHNYVGAIKIYSQIIEEDKLFDEAYLYRGELFGKTGQIQNGISDVLKAVELDPNYFEAYLSLAELYKSQNNYDEAIQTYIKAISLKKNTPTVITKLTELLDASTDKYLAQYQPERAVANFREAINYVQDNTPLLFKYAFSLERAGQFDDALKYIDIVLQRVSDDAPTKTLLAVIYEKTGQIDKGWQLIDELFNANPYDAYINNTYGNYAFRMGQQLMAIPKLQHTLKQATLNTEDELCLHMLLGKLFDSIGDYENAFSSFSKANTLKYNDYDINEIEAQVSNQINFFSKEKYTALPSAVNDSSNCIFILGMPRSGTSLIEQIVSSHSKVFGGGELPFVPQMVHTIKTSRFDLDFPQVLDVIDDNELNAYAGELLSSLKSISPESQKVTDKLPHNYWFIGLIHKLLPNAKIINCLRDPIDNCLSCYFQHFAGHHPYAYNLDHLGIYYRQYQRLMSHWEKTLDIPILNVRYEDVVSDTKTEVEKILSHLNLDWEDACLDFYKSKRKINTSSYAQVNTNIYTSSVQRWKSYEPYISELINELGDNQNL